MNYSFNRTMVFFTSFVTVCACFLFAVRSCSSISNPDKVVTDDLFRKELVHLSPKEYNRELGKEIGLLIPFGKDISFRYCNTLQDGYSAYICLQGDKDVFEAIGTSVGRDSEFSPVVTRITLDRLTALCDFFSWEINHMKPSWWPKCPPPNATVAIMWREPSFKMQKTTIMVFSESEQKIWIWQEWRRRWGFAGNGDN